MATSGTYNFNPGAGDLILNSFGMIQIRRWELTQQHLEDAATQANLLMVDWSNRNPNCWARETQEVSLSPGTPGYDLANRTVAVVLVTIQNTVAPLNRRVLGPLSANDYGSIQNPLQQGAPSAYYFSLNTPTPRVYVWNAPDQNGPYTLRLETFRQMQDVVLRDGVTIDSPFRFLDAFSTGMAYRLARIYPEKLAGKTIAELKADYEAAFQLAASRDQESTPMYVSPIMSSYFR